MNQNKDRGFKGVWIPKEIWLSEDLSLQEKVFLVEIESLDRDEKGCFASNNYFAEFFNLTRQRCSQIISSLEEKKWVIVNYEWSGKEVKRRLIKVVNKFDRGGKYPLGGVKKIHRGCQINAKDNNTINNTINNTKEREFISSLSEKQKEKWNDWKNYRKEIKKKMTDRTISLQINLLEKDLSAMEEIINTSIQNGWTGLFEKKESFGGSKPAGVIRFKN